MPAASYSNEVYVPRRSVRAVIRRSYVPVGKPKLTPTPSWSTIPVTRQSPVSCSSVTCRDAAPGAVAVTVPSRDPPLKLAYDSVHAGAVPPPAGTGA